MQNENEKSIESPALDYSQKRKLNFFKKIAAFVGLTGSLVIGANNVINTAKQEQQFPDGYRAIPKPELYVSAPNSVIAPADTNSTEVKPLEPVELTEPYVTAVNSPVIEVAPTTPKVTELDTKEQSPIVTTTAPNTTNVDSSVNTNK